MYLFNLLKFANKMGSNTSYIDMKPTVEEEKQLDKEFQKLKNSKYIPLVKCEYKDNNKKHWEIIFKGSECSPYEDGYFILDFLFNKGTFPSYGPEAKFVTKMFHPNIDSDGHVCINILNSWSPGRTMEDVLLGILEILENPIATGGYPNDARKLLEKDVDEFYKKVEEYTYSFAMKGF